MVLTLSVHIYPKSKLSPEMPQIQVPEKEPRKRRSTTSIRENEESRKKVAHAPEEKGEEEEIDMSDMMVEIKEIKVARQRTEEQAREAGRRVEKKTRLKIRRQCCGCGEMAVVKSDGETNCCKHICVTCLRP